MPKKRILLVDDSATVRGVVRPLFDFHPNFEVCGEAEHGREAVESSESPTRRRFPLESSNGTSPK
jgi:DNA-binding NarL/FixJ family response regulator